MCLALAEQGARVYALDLPDAPSSDFKAVSHYVSALGEGRTLQYVSVDVTDQRVIWAKVEESMLVFISPKLSFSRTSSSR